MKIRLLIIFIFSLISLLFVAGKMLINSKEFTSKNSVAHADSPDITIYSDSMQPGFSNWSWNSSVAIDNTEHPNSGGNDIAFTPNSYGALYLHTDTSLDSAAYDSLQLSIRASTDNQKFVVMLYDDNNQPVQSGTPLENFGGDVTKESYKQYTISLATLNPSNKPIKGIALQETSGQMQPTLYLDDIMLKAKQTASATPTITPAPSLTITQTATVTAAPTSAPATPITSTTASLVYADSLSDDYENWSWDSSIIFDNPAPFYSGTKSLKFTTTNAWGGLYLHRKSLLDTTSLSSFSFNLRGSSEDQKYTLVLKDQNNNNLGSPLPLATIGGDPLATLWRTYTVSLSLLSADHKTVSGIVIQDASGHTQPPLYIDNIKFKGTSSTTASTITIAPSPSAPPTTMTVSPSDPFSGVALYVKPNSSAKITADSLRAVGKMSDADAMMKIASHPTALWATNNNSLSEVSNYVKKAGESGQMAVIVSYNIPGRDCGQYSSGGSDYNGYKNWITNLSSAIGSNKTAVILEPDSLGLDCLQNDNTYSLLNYAIDTLSAKPNISVYVEASSWIPASTMSQRLKKIGIEKAKGFSLNTSGYNTTSSMIAYGNTLSAKVGGKHFVIDTSRNGNGPYDQSQPEPWCNPPGRALGQFPTANTGYTNVDAYLWIKIPGESDGTCRGGPSAGSWWSEYALSLAK